VKLFKAEDHEDLQNQLSVIHSDEEWAVAVNQLLSERLKVGYVVYPIVTDGELVIGDEKIEDDRYRIFYHTEPLETEEVTDCDHFFEVEIFANDKININFSSRDGCYCPKCGEKMHAN